MLRSMLPGSTAALIAIALVSSCQPRPGAQKTPQASTAPQARPSSAAPQGSYRILGSTFLAVSVADADASAAWYAKTLGLELTRSIDTPDGKISIRILAREGLMVELIAQAGSLPLEQLAGPDGPLKKQIFVRGLFKAGFFVDDAQAIQEHLGTLDVSMDARVIVDADMDLKFFVFRDLDGNRLQAFQRCDAQCRQGGA